MESRFVLKKFTTRSQYAVMRMTHGDVPKFEDFSPNPVMYRRELRNMTRREQVNILVDMLKEKSIHVGKSPDEMRKIAQDKLNVRGLMDDLSLSLSLFWLYHSTTDWSWAEVGHGSFNCGRLSDQGFHCQGGKGHRSR
jgi:hypothetical protein